MKVLHLSIIRLKFLIIIVILAVSRNILTVQKRVYQSFDQNDDMIKVTQQSKATPTAKALKQN